MGFFLFFYYDSLAWIFYITFSFQFFLITKKKPEHEQMTFYSTSYTFANMKV